MIFYKDFFELFYIKDKMQKHLQLQKSSCSSMVDQRPPKPKVGGSIPLMGAF
jgi:hypothetical protein